MVRATASARSKSEPPSKADAVARTIVAPAELPIGIVTAVAGAPFFLWILLRKRSVIDL
ncbi:MAG: hypothetical protein E5V63_09460, partial [Mesorhizobium sp.]